MLKLARKMLRELFAPVMSDDKIRPMIELRSPDECPHCLGKITDAGHDTSESARTFDVICSAKSSAN
jgi:hypothetical protein